VHQVGRLGVAEEPGVGLAPGRHLGYPDGDFHEFMKAYMEKTCPSNSWDRPEHELEKYRDLSKVLKLCG
jgi:hypothetical protein